MLQASHPTIETTGNGDTISRIYFNERTRDSWRSWGAGDAQCSPEFYDALQQFEKLVEDDRFHINTPLQPGEMVLFDNARVLHSRTEFVGERHMEGTYLEWGAAYATWRSLQSIIRQQPDVYCGNVAGIGGAQM